MLAWPPSTIRSRQVARGGHRARRWLVKLRRLQSDAVEIQTASNEYLAVAQEDRCMQFSPNRKARGAAETIDVERIGNGGQAGYRRSQRVADLATTQAQVKQETISSLTSRLCQGADQDRRRTRWRAI